MTSWSSARSASASFGYTCSSMNSVIRSRSSITRGLRSKSMGCLLSEAIGTYSAGKPESPKNQLSIA